MARHQTTATENLGGKLANFVLESAMSYRDELRCLLREKSLVRGEVTLSSGARSSYYFDCKLTTLDPRGAYITGRAMLELLHEERIEADAIGGLTMGADPIVSAVTLVSHLESRPLPGFLIRKEQKGHGMMKQIEGVKLEAGMRVVIIDEVCTTGGSILEAIRIADAQGFRIVAVISLLDREEGGSEKLRRMYPYHALVTAKELLQGDDERTCEAS
jgi:orotate phosphoribosyltransferase